jgi:endonuclease/exonuclease/phosphatase family metal-dependent hydrolase
MHCILLLFIIACSSCTLSPISVGSSLTILSYNVENLFDDVDNGSEYSDFDPGEGVWNTDFYHTRLANIAEVIKASIKGGPDILALQEVENFKALVDLRDNYLNGLGYRYGIIADDDGSAVNTAFLSKIPISDFSAHRSQVVDIRLRSVLEARFNAGGIDLVIFNCHWKSKSGGAEVTEELRVASARIISGRVRELLSSDSDLEILVAGDLNERIDEFEACGGSYQTAIVPVDAAVPESYYESSIGVTSDLDEIEVSEERVVLFSPWFGASSPGSYVYAYQWEKIDHFLLAGGLLDNVGLRFESFTVVNRDFMMNASGYPKRWNTRLAGGYSDHLPLLLHLTK